MKICHAALYVEDLVKAKDFFIRYFDAIPGDEYHNVRTGFRSYLLRFEDGAKLEIMTRGHLTKNPNSDVPSLGYHHISFSVGGKEEVDRMTLRFAQDGNKVLDGPRTTGDGYYECCVEGILIEVTV